MQLADCPLIRIDLLDCGFPRTADVWVSYTYLPVSEDVDHTETGNHSDREREYLYLSASCSKVTKVTSFPLPQDGHVFLLSK